MDEKEIKEIKITLTREFHDAYWQNLRKATSWAIIALGCAITILIIGLIFSTPPKPCFDLFESTILNGCYISLVIASLSIGVYVGIKMVGNKITERIKEEHPELLKEKDLIDIEKLRKGGK
jgi:hypothetical protein